MNRKEREALDLVSSLKSDSARRLREHMKRRQVEGVRELRRATAMRCEDQPALTADDIKSLVEEGRR